MGLPSSRSDRAYSFIARFSEGGFDGRACDEMSGAGGFAVALAALAGLGGAVQAAVMGELGDRVGVLPAVAFSTLVGAVIGATALLVTRRSLGGIGDVVQQ